MPNNNNIYKNAAYAGFIQGMLAGRRIHGSDTTVYTEMKASALAMAQDVDALIPYDILVSTNGVAEAGPHGPAQAATFRTLQSAINALAADATIGDLQAAINGDGTDVGLSPAAQQWRAGILHDLCSSAMQGAMQLNATRAGALTSQAQAIVAAWGVLVTGLIVP